MGFKTGTHRHLSAQGALVADLHGVDALHLQPATIGAGQAEIGSREALREAVVRGIGLGVVSEAEFIPRPQLEAIRIEGDPVYTETYLYCLAERRTSQVVGTFLGCADQARLRR